MTRTSPSKPDLCGAGKRRSESKGRIAPKRKTYFKARRADQVGEIGFKEPSQQVEAQERIAFLLFWLSKYVFCVQSGGVVKELAKLAIILANGQKVNMAPLGLYRGLKTLTYQIGDGSPISGHGPLWILKLWIHAYFPQFGANELKERLTSGSEENFACYVDVLRLSPSTTCSFQECFEAFYTKETIETFTPFSERRLSRFIQVWLLLSSLWWHPWISIVLDSVGQLSSSQRLALPSLNGSTKQYLWSGTVLPSFCIKEIGSDPGCAVSNYVHH